MACTGDLPATDADFVWIELRIGNALLILFPREGDADAGPAAPTHVPWVFVDDLDAHLARAQAGGATIVQDVWQHGFRAYEAEDVEGHRWTFVQAGPNMR